MLHIILNVKNKYRLEPFPSVALISAEWMGWRGYGVMGCLTVCGFCRYRSRITVAFIRQTESFWTPLHNLNWVVCLKRSRLKSLLKTTYKGSLPSRPLVALFMHIYSAVVGCAYADSAEVDCVRRPDPMEVLGELWIVTDATSSCPTPLPVSTRPASLPKCHTFKTHLWLFINTIFIGRQLIKLPVKSTKKLVQVVQSICAQNVAWYNSYDYKEVNQLLEFQAIWLTVGFIQTYDGL